MKNPFYRFVIRYLLMLLLGLGLLALHGAGGPAAVLAPQYTNPWELSKLAYWPMLGALVLSRVISGKGAGSGSGLPTLALTPAVVFLSLWLISPLEPTGGVCLLIWMVCGAFGTALADRCSVTARQRGVWLVLAAGWAVLYLLFTLFPPAIGPFLDPASAAAMATIPY